MEHFSGRRLRAMILPLFVEQLLVMVVGLTDTLMVSHVGEAAVSGVALVNQFNIIFLYLFLALASGGAVVISQYIGRRENEQAGRTASQLLALSIVVSLGLTGFVLAGGQMLLSLLFGRVEPDVMAACSRYLQITACGYPAMAVYYAGAAICRSLGKTSITMYITAIACVLNAVGDFLGVFVLRAGVAGVAWPFVTAWMISALLITVVCFGKGQAVAYRIRWIFAWNGVLMRRILSIAIPNGIESGVFQLVKVALTSMAALFGTYQIAANGVAQSIWSLAALAGVYHSHRPMRGSKRFGGGCLLFSQTGKIYAGFFYRLEYPYPCDYALCIGFLRISTGDQETGPVAGLDSQCIQCGCLSLFRRVQQWPAGGR